VDYGASVRPLLNKEEIRAEIDHEKSHVENTKKNVDQIGGPNRVLDFAYGRVRSQSQEASVDQAKSTGENGVFDVDDLDMKFSSLSLNNYRPTRKQVDKGLLNNPIFNSASAYTVSMLSALTTDGVLTTRVVEGGVDASVFELYFLETWAEARKYKGERRVVFFMDNATIHKAKTVRNTLEECSEVVLYNTQYTPEANPIEYLFGYVKHNLRKSPLGT
jgi:hypothetical protein